MENDKSGKATVLFIDELNRAEYSVLQELMQLVNDRQINHFKLPESTMLICAGNPDDSGNYQVNILNDALKDRFIWFNMESDINAWLGWASRSDVHPNVIEFIADHNEFLHIQNDRDEIKPTPRSWHKFSDILKQYLEENNYESTESLAADNHYDFISNIGIGIVGVEASSALISFLTNSRNPIISFDELFGNKAISDEELSNKMVKETNPRLNVMYQRIIREFEDRIDVHNKLKLEDDERNRFIYLLDKTPSDLKVSVMNGIKRNNPVFHNILMSDKKYVDMYLGVFQRISRAK